MSGSSSPRVVLVSIDGWGFTAQTKGNAIANANTPVMDAFAQSDLYALIDASGLSVGLPRGVMGNSEVGHLTMGAGRVEYQDLVRINKSIEDGQFATNPTLQKAFDTAKAGTGRLHLLGLVSDGGVHSHIEHVEQFLLAAKAVGVPRTFLHFFADGRDTKPKSGTSYVRRIADFMSQHSYGSIASVVGRYYAMDRDKRWERVQIAYDLITAGKGDIVPQAQLIEFIENQRYANNESDEFLKPILVDHDAVIRPGDTAIFFDFRSDRMREIGSLFANPGEALPFNSDSSLDRAAVHPFLMTQYDEKWSVPILFPPQSSVNGLSEWLSKSGLRQFHTAETEKYAHVTFFFGGGREEPFPNEDRGLIPSPKVATYDLSPEMAQAAVADSVIDAINRNEHAFILCNFAAPDMVGHTGVYDAALRACAACDTAIGRIAQACEQHGVHLIITADHGNAEEMLDADGKPKTSHTTNCIPFIVQPAPAAKGRVNFTQHVAAIKQKDASAAVGGLSDVAPSVLSLLGLPKPSEMTGTSLLAVTQ